MMASIPVAMFEVMQIGKFVHGSQVGTWKSGSKAVGKYQLS